MKELIVLLGTKANYVSHETEQKIMERFMPDAGIVTSGPGVTDPKWLGKKLKKKGKMLACAIGTRQGSTDFYLSKGGPKNELSGQLLAASENETSFEVVLRFVSS